MIPLDIQIKSIVFSFLYGMFFSFLLNLNYKFIYYSKGILKILINIFFVVDNVLLYFIILRYINNGIVHFYFLLSLVIGYFSVNKVSSRLRNIFNLRFFLMICAIIFVQVRIMSRKLTKKSKKRVLFICVGTITFISLITVNIFSVWKQLLEKREEKLFYTEELEKLKEEEAYLKVEVEKLQDPDYVARYAREQYLYSKDGEFNIRIN